MIDRESLAAALEVFVSNGEFQVIADAAHQRLAQLSPYSGELVERISNALTVAFPDRPLRVAGLVLAVLDALGETGAVDHNLIEHDPDDLNYRGDPNYHKRMD